MSQGIPLACASVVHMACGPGAESHVPRVIQLAEVLKRLGSDEISPAQVLKICEPIPSGYLKAHTRPARVCNSYHTCAAVWLSVRPAAPISECKDAQCSPSPVS